MAGTIVRYSGLLFCLISPFLLFSLFLSLSRLPLLVGIDLEWIEVLFHSKESWGVQLGLGCHDRRKIKQVGVVVTSKQTPPTWPCFWGNFHTSVPRDWHVKPTVSDKCFHRREGEYKGEHIGSFKPGIYISGFWCCDSKVRKWSIWGIMLRLLNIQYLSRHPCFGGIWYLLGNWTFFNN